MIILLQSSSPSRYFVTFLTNRIFHFIQMFFWMRRQKHEDGSSKVKRKEKKTKKQKTTFHFLSLWNFLPFFLELSPPPPYIHNKHLKLERWRNIIYNNFIFSPSHALRNWWAVSRNRLPSPSTLPFLFLFCCRRRILLCIPEASNPSVCAALLLYSYVIL